MRLLLSLTLALFAAPQASQPQEQPIRDLVERYHAALAAEDATAAFALWSPRAPDLKLARFQIELRFKDDDRTTSATTIRRLQVAGSRADVRVALDQRITSLKTGETIEKTIVRHYEVRLEESEWRIWRDMTAEEAISRAVADEKDSAAQQRTLDGEREHWTIELFRQLAMRGTQAYLGGQYDAALALNTAGLRVAEVIGETKAINAGHYDIGNIHYMLRRYPLALEAYERSRVSSEKTGDAEMHAQALLGLATVHYVLGDYSASHQRFTERLAIIRRLEDRQGIASTLTSLGDVLYWQGDYPASRTHYLEALPLLAALDHPTELTRAHAGVAGVFAAQGDAAQALDYYGKAIADTMRTGDKAARARALAGMGHVFFDHGYPARALASFGDSLAIEDALKQPDGIASVLASMAVVHATEGRHLEAIGAYTKSLPYFEAARDFRGFAGAHLGLGLAHASMEKRPEALALYQVALDRFTALDDADGQSRAWLGIGLVHVAARDPKLALDAASQSIALATKAENDFTIWRANVVAGRALRALDRPVEARAAFEQSIRVREASRYEYGPSRQFAGLSDEGLDPYDALVELFVADGRLPDALTTADRARQRTIADILGRFAVEIDTGLSAEERARERKLLADLASLRTQYLRVKRQRTPDPARAKLLLARLTAARADHQRLLDTLFAREPSLRAARAESAAISPGELSTLLDDRTALIQFVAVDERVVVLVAARPESAGTAPSAPSPLLLAPAQPTRRAAPAVQVSAHTFAIEQGALISRVLGIRQLVRMADPSAAGELQALAGDLLGPALPRLRTRERLVIVPDGILWHLPFQALVGFDDRFLGETHEIALAPSLSALRDFPRATGSFAGGPVLSLQSPSIAPAVASRLAEALKAEELPRSEELAEPATPPVESGPPAPPSLADLYGSDVVRIFHGADATAARLAAEAPVHSIVQLAVPAVVDDTSPLFSYLSVSPTQDGGTGLLEAWELMELPLTGKRLVLPLATPRMSRMLAGRGMLGFAWTALVAGADALVVSHWSVDTPPADDVLVGWHRTATQMAPERGMQSAITAALSTTPQTFDWARFAVITLRR